ncbi:hypothetical protein HYQ46_004746 [Verticillium longisporum]|nr:hypothetical protein HYQ44_011118 [Verticillium longisporum]KAG7146455.1 hypothetical protein HYQ46_004746 [Verticillium longisporum]
MTYESGAGCYGTQGGQTELFVMRIVNPSKKYKDFVTFPGHGLRFHLSMTEYTENTVRMLLVSFIDYLGTSYNDACSGVTA